MRSRTAAAFCLVMFTVSVAVMVTLLFGIPTKHWFFKPCFENWTRISQVTYGTQTVYRVDTKEPWGLFWRKGFFEEEDLGVVFIRRKFTIDRLNRNWDRAHASTKVVVLDDASIMLETQGGASR